MAVAGSIQSIRLEILRIPGLQPSNCGEPTEVKEADDIREAYDAATEYIDENPSTNCATVGADYRVRCFQATVFPVKFEKVDNNTICFYHGTLKVKYPANFSF